MNRIEEKLYLEIVLDCENESCEEIFDPDEDARDPMEEWASKNAIQARTDGWKVTELGKVFCPKCAKAT